MATGCLNTLTLLFTQVIMPPKTRKSKRTSAVAWKEGNTRALLGEPSCCAPKENAATRKKAAKEWKLKEQARKAKAKKTDCDVRDAAKLKDTLAKEREEAEHAFPCHLNGMFN